MRKILPPTSVAPGHIDFDVLSVIADEIIHRAGGSNRLAEAFPALLRECVDDVIQTPRTGRVAYEQLEKTEKTYIGTRVEIALRSYLDLPRGKLDTVIAGYDTDIKHTMGNNWMIPSEALYHPCILVAADESSGLCFLGLIVARPEYLTAGANRDAKKSISAIGFENILWVLREHAYPPNFWRTIPPDVVDRIFSGSTGNERVKILFREVQGRPISRDVVNAVARQKDFTRRIRADGGNGTRDQLADEGIVLLSGSYGRELIEQFRLPECGKSEFISHMITSEDERRLARLAGFDI